MKNKIFFLVILFFFVLKSASAFAETEVRRGCFNPQQMAFFNLTDAMVKQPGFEGKFLNQEFYCWEIAYLRKNFGSDVIVTQNGPVQINFLISQNSFENLYNMPGQNIVFSEKEIQRMRQYGITPDLVSKLPQDVLGSGLSSDEVIESAIYALVFKQRQYSSYFITSPVDNGSNFIDKVQFNPLGMAVAGGAVGSVVPGVGTAMGVFVGSLTGVAFSSASEIAAKSILTSENGTIFNNDNFGVLSILDDKICSDPALQTYLPVALRPIVVQGKKMLNAFGDVIAEISSENKAKDKEKHKHEIVFAQGLNANTFTGSYFTCEPSPLALLVDQFSECWLCDLFRAAYNAISVYSYKIFQETRTSARNLLAIFLALWLLYRTLIMLGAVKAESPIDYWDDISKKFFMSMFAALVLLMNSPSFVFSYTVEPIINLGVSYGRVVIATGNPSVDVQTCFKNVDEMPTIEEGKKIIDASSKATFSNLKGKKRDQAFEKNFSQTEKEINDKSLQAYIKENNLLEGGALSAQTRESLVCLISSLTRQNGMQLAIGSILIDDKSFSTEEKSFYVLPHFGMLFTRFYSFYCFLCLLNLLFPFYIIEAIFHVGIVGVLMPLLIVAWVIDATRKYAEQAFEDGYQCGHDHYDALCCSWYLGEFKVMEVIYSPESETGTLLLQSIESGEHATSIMFDPL